MSSTSLRATLVLLVGLVMGTPAHARTADWNDFVEPATARPSKTANSAKPIRTAAKERVKKRKQASHSVAKKKSRAGSRAKAKRPARRGHHR